MPPRKKTGRAAAEAKYAELLKENTALVGDVGDTYEAFLSALESTQAAAKRYEESRTAAVKSGAVSADQLDHMGYKRPPKLPAVPPHPTQGGEVPASPPKPNPATNGHTDPHAVTTGAAQ